MFYYLYWHGYLFHGLWRLLIKGSGIDMGEYEEVEIDMSSFDKQALLLILEEMHENDETFNVFVNRVLKDIVKKG